MDEHIIHLNYLSATMKKVSRSRDWNESLDNIFEFTGNLLEYDMMVIYLIDKKAGILKAIAARGSKDVKLKNRARFKIGEGIVGWVAKEKKAVIIADATKETQFKVRQFYKEDPVIRSYIALPLIYENEVLGILSISSSKPDLYREKDVQMMTIIASQVAAIFKINSLLRDETRFSNHILQSIDSGVLVIDKEKKVIHFNRAAENITGYTAKELKGKKITLTPLMTSPFPWLILKTHETQEHIFEKETHMFTKEGREIQVIVSTSVLRNEYNEFNGATAIFRDISEVKKLQEEVRRVDRLASLGKLTAGVAHEIRNPLLPIRTAASYLLKKTNPDSENYRLLKIINEEAERMNKLLNDFVSFAKPPSEMKEAFDLNKLIAETTALMKHEFESKDIEVELNLCHERTSIMGLAQEFRQVLLNLLINSMDAMPEGGKINITTYREDPYIYLIVKDQGTGISKEHLNKVFDPFFTTKQEGTGLGLFIVHNIVSKYDGKIEVESEKGRGTAFKVRIKTTI